MIFRYEHVKLVRVIDGDTWEFYINNGFNNYHQQRIRMDGGDTPETRTRNKKEKAAGKKVTQFVKSMFKLYKTFTLISYGEAGKYGGTAMGDVEFKDNVLLSDILLKKGYARPFDGDTAKPAWTDEELDHILNDLS